MRYKVKIVFLRYIIQIIVGEKICGKKSLKCDIHILHKITIQIVANMINTIMS